MTGKMKLYIGLLVLGLLLVGGGLWFLLNPVPVIDIPEGDPVIAMNVDYIMGGRFNSLRIYEDRTVIYHEDKGLRMSTPEHPPTRTWKTGKLEEEELNSLIDFFKSSQFDELDSYYQFPDPSWESGTISDMDCTVSIDYGDLHKAVRAFGYLTPDKGLTYPDMPYPLNEIYKKLKDIAENKTAEVYRETI
jgi:hypothetical protein